MAALFVNIRGLLMKILMLEWKSFGNEDIAAAFKELGHEVKAVPFSNKELHHDEEEEKKLVSMIREFSPDFLFSFNSSLSQVKHNHYL